MVRVVRIYYEAKGHITYLVLEMYNFHHHCNFGTIFAIFLLPPWPQFFLIKFLLYPLKHFILHNFEYNHFPSVSNCFQDIMGYLIILK